MLFGVSERKLAVPKVPFALKPRGSFLTPLESLMKRQKSEWLRLERHLVYSSSGPLFKSQQPYGDSQLSVNSSPKGSIILFSPPQVPGMHVVHKHTCRQNIHTLKNKFFLKLWIIEKWVIALFTTNYRQPSLEVRCVHGSKSVPVGEHLNTGQSLYSALPNSVFWCDRLTTWYLVRHFGLAFITIPWHTYREKRWVFKVVFICF